MTTAAHKQAAYPHQGACVECREAKRCNYCGADTARDLGRCTNGRCAKCHKGICTPGGITSPGHGYGKQGADWERAKQ